MICGQHVLAGQREKQSSVIVSYDTFGLVPNFDLKQTAKRLGSNDEWQVLSGEEEEFQKRVFQMNKISCFLVHVGMVLSSIRMTQRRSSIGVRPFSV